MRKMIHSTGLGLIALLTVLALSGCASAGLVGASPLATATLPPAAPPVAPAAPIVAPTATPAPTQTPLPTATNTATPAPKATATPTKRPTAVRPRATATPVIPPGVYVTGLTVDPAVAHSNQTPLFTVTFLNTTAQTQRFTWYVKIFSPDQQNSFGETAKIPNDISANSSQLPAVANWQTQSFFGCLFFAARAFWVDPSGQAIEFLKPDGTTLATAFSVCP